MLPNFSTLYAYLSILYPSQNVESWQGGKSGRDPFLVWMRLTAGSKTTQQFLLHASDHVSWICTEDYGYTIDFCVKIWSRHFDTFGVGNGMKDVGKTLISPSLFYTNWQDQNVVSFTPFSAPGTGKSTAR